MHRSFGAKERRLRMTKGAKERRLRMTKGWVGGADRSKKKLMTTGAPAILRWLSKDWPGRPMGERTLFFGVRVQSRNPRDGGKMLGGIREIFVTFETHCNADFRSILRRVCSG